MSHGPSEGQPNPMTNAPAARPTWQHLRHRSQRGEAATYTREVHSLFLSRFSVFSVILKLFLGILNF